MSQDVYMQGAEQGLRSSAGGGSNQVRVRAYNERLVLSLVRQEGAQSPCLASFCRSS